MRLCPTCKVELEEKNIIGMNMPWNNGDVTLSVDTMMPTCPECTEMFVWGHYITNLDTALEKSLNRGLK